MMWKASVNAIWLRAASSCEVSSNMAGDSAAGHTGLGLGQAGLELAGAEAVDRGHGLPHRVDEGLVHDAAALGVVDRDQPSRSVGQRGVELLADPALEPVLGELADHAAGGGADRRPGQQRRCKQAVDEPPAAPEFCAFAAKTLAGLDHVYLAVG